MKIALSFPGCHHRGGVERIVHQCARYLDSRGHQVRVIASDIDRAGLGEGVVSREVKLPRVPGWLRGRAYFHRASSVIEAENDFDVLNTHGCVCPHGGVQWVQSVHLAWLETSRKFRRIGSPAWIRQRLNPLHPVLLRLERSHFAERRYKHLIVTTPHVREDLGRLYGVPAADTTVVPNGFDPEVFSPARRSLRRDKERASLGLADDQIALLFVANELERKGLPVLLAAIKRLADPRFRVLVVGRRPVMEVERYARDSGVAPHQVIACGVTSDVSRFHAAADAFVLPTQYEALCLAILEALGSGLPVITTTVPGAGDAIVQGLNGYAISNPLDSEPLAEAIRALGDRGHRDRLSAAASPSVERFQWPVVLAEYESVLSRFARSAGVGSLS